MLILALGLALTAGGAEVTECLTDPAVAWGLILQDPKPGKRVDLAAVTWGEAGAAAPVWGLAQWSSRFPLTAGPARPVEGGGWELANEAKRVAWSTAETGPGGVVLAVDAVREYDGRLRQRGEPWVHLLLQQSLRCPLDLSQIRSIRFHSEARLLYRRAPVGLDQDPRLHAAQFQFFITVQNRNRQSPGYGDYYWFGIPMYDNRERIPRRLIHGDQGTGKLIYSLPGDALATASLHDGEWVTFSGELLPAVLAGLETAWERGFLPASRDLSDYRLGGMNVGWEVPGVDDVAVALRGMSLTVAGGEG